MSHYERHYNIIPTREGKDEQAIKDIKEYANEEMWDLILVESGKVEQIGTAAAFQELNRALAFCGIQGYPVHALGRKFCKTAYRAWMHDGKDPIMTDEAGFPLMRED
jgi:hypothetical protein